MLMWPMGQHSYFLRLPTASYCHLLSLSPYYLVISKRDGFVISVSSTQTKRSSCSRLPSSLLPQVSVSSGQPQSKGNNCKIPEIRIQKFKLDDIPSCTMMSCTPTLCQPWHKLSLSSVSIQCMLAALLILYCLCSSNINCT